RARANRRGFARSRECPIPGGSAAGPRGASPLVAVLHRQGNDHPGGVCSQEPDRTQNQHLGRTLRPSVLSRRLTFYQEEFTFFSDQRNSLILKWNEFSGTTIGRNLAPLLSGYKSNRINWLPEATKSISESDA